jgi:hypothetical protein
MQPERERQSPNSFCSQSREVNVITDWAFGRAIKIALTAISNKNNFFHWAECPISGDVFAVLVQQYV